MLNSFQQQMLYEQACAALSEMTAKFTETMDAIKAAAWQYEEAGRTLNRHTDGQIHA